MKSRKPWVLVLVVSVTALACVPRRAAGQDRLSYELVSASIAPRTIGDVHAGDIIIEFGRSMPARYMEAENKTLEPAPPCAAPCAMPEWRLELRELANPAVVTTVDVSSVFVSTPVEDLLVALQPAARVDPSTHQIRVFLLEANFPQVVVNQPKKQAAAGFYGPAKGRDDADLYFKGLVVGTSGSKPAYSIDAKAGYFRGGRSNWGSFGASATYLVDKASDIGPDSITANAKYSKVFVWAAATGLILDADVLGFEFTAANDTRNVRSAATGQFVFRSLKLKPKSFVTGDIVTGFESGHNSTNTVTANSLGGFWRTIVGGNGYLLLQGTPVVPRIDVTASWKVRLLAQDEPFTHRVDGRTITELSGDARHLFTVNAALMVTKALGFSIGYRHGSEPPAYKHVRHRAEIGFVFKLKQVDKG